MNFVDYVLLALLLAMIIVGSKKGLLRELTAIITIIPSVIVSINFMDTLAVAVYERIGGSPMVVTFLSFILLLGLTYAAFKLLGMGFAKVVKLQKQGRKDQVGGAFLGFIRGWVMMSFIFFLLFLLPMPAGFYVAVENSFFGPTLIKTVPIMYETSSALHPKNPSFYNKVESALTLKKSGGGLPAEVKGDVDLVLYQIQRFYESPEN